jgi:FHS family L-fucose permease-like MFS transporter
MANISTSESAPLATTGLPASTNKAALAMVTFLFFMWGFLTVLNDILIPLLKQTFSLNYAEVMLTQFVFFSAYFVFAFPSGILIERAGYKKAMVTGLVTMGAGALLIVPAASLPAFPVFLAGLIVLAAGMTVLQVSANPYVAVLGPEKTASSRLNLAQAFNSLGTMIGPYLGGLVILTAAPLAADVIAGMSGPELHAYRLGQLAPIKLPYLAFGIILIAFAIAMAVFRLPDMAAEQKADARKHGSVWRHRHLVLGALAIFVYVGAEVSIGSFLVSYFSQPYIGNLPLKVAAGYVSFYWGGAMVGRFVGSALLQKIRTGTLLGIFAIVAGSLVCASMLSFGHVAMWTIIAVGLFNSIMFPSIFTLGIDGLGPLTGEGSGILVAAIVGGAIIPELQGVIADRIGIHHAFFLPVLCYIYIAFFAFRGSRHEAQSTVTTV